MKTYRVIGHDENGISYIIPAEANEYINCYVAAKLLARQVAIEQNITVDKVTWTVGTVDRELIIKE